MRRLALGMFLVIATILGGLPVAEATGSVFISEYVEGSSNNKAIEIYNDTGAPVDLGTSVYDIQIFANGAATATSTILLTGTVAAGDVYVIAHTGASSAVTTAADQASGVLSFNGNDAVVLRAGGVTLDVIGQIGFDPTFEWGTGNTSTADNTIRRKPLVRTGDADGSDTFDPFPEWDGFVNDTFTGLGSHTVDIDTDGDGIADGSDACPNGLAAGTDTDGDGCKDDTEDPDDDNDTIGDGVDNCPLDANTSQTNTDSDDKGNACDPDDDNDNALDGSDNCPLDANADQADADSDNTGNACDGDDDNDTVLDGSDNCPLDVNTDQTNTDSDDKGDACDPDDDNDNVADGSDQCPAGALTGTDTDGDGCKNSEDDDDDNDGVLDASDNCSLVSNATQTDTDSDNAGDACDDDDDNDGVLDGSDGCPQGLLTGTDTDGDGCKNSEDGDDDNDTVDDANDSCDLVAAATTSGCPASAESLTLAYKATKRKFVGALTSAVAQCLASRPVEIYREAGAVDTLIGTATTSATGSFSFKKRARKGTYYATVDPTVLTDMAECSGATSPPRRVR